MTLTYGFSAPQDILAKAKRDLARLLEAEKHGSSDSMADALLDVSVTLTSLKDWLKQHPGSSYKGSDVESFMSTSVAISSLRDLANAGKHRIITHYIASVTDVTSSAVAPVDPTLGTDAGQAQKMKVTRTDGSRLRASELAETAVSDWEHFMQLHGVAHDA